jgi:hypothetical protein
VYFGGRRGAVTDLQTLEFEPTSPPAVPPPTYDPPEFRPGIKWGVQEGEPEALFKFKVARELGYLIEAFEREPENKEEIKEFNCELTDLVKRVEGLGPYIKQVKDAALKLDGRSFEEKRAIKFDGHRTSCAMANARWQPSRSWNT